MFINEKLQFGGFTMNASKKIMNQGKKEETGSSYSVSAPKSTTRLGSGSGGPNKKAYVLGGFCVVLIAVLCIGVAAQQFKSTKVLSIDDTNLTMDDMMYPIYERESMYLPSNETYESYFNTSIWDTSYMGSDSTVDSSLTNSQGLKQEIINAETEYEVLYREAQDAKYTLTDDEKKEAEEKAGDAVKGLSFVQKLQLSISKKKLTSRFEKRILADRYKEERREETDATVNEKDAIKDVSKEKLREYDVQYYAFAKSSTDPSTGQQITMTEEQIKTSSKNIKALAKKAKKAKDFTTLLDEKETQIKFDSAEFTEEQGWSSFLSEDNLKKVKALKNGEISGVIEDKTTGYYMVVKMVDNNSTTSYDEACNEAIETAKQEAYNAWLEEIKKKYTIKQYAETWDDVVIGTVTTDIVTAEDLLRMSKEGSSEGSSESGK